MTRKFTSIHEAAWKEGKNPEGESWRFLDLSGERLGVRIEEIPPGGTSSVHHYHTLEEEHVLILEGAATLILGTEEHDVGAGDHVWFAAGKEEAHHLENRTTENFKFLVFGERNHGDTVFYPEHRVMLVKALGRKLFTYERRARPGEPEDGA